MLMFLIATYPTSHSPSSNPHDFPLLPPLPPTPFLLTWHDESIHSFINYDMHELSSFEVYGFIEFLSWDYCCEESGCWMPLWMVVANIGNESSTLWVMAIKKWITQLCWLRTLILQVQWFFFPILIKILVFSCNLYCSSGCSSNVFNVFECIPCLMFVIS